MTISEWYTPPEVMERVRRVLGRIDLDPASCHYSNKYCVKAERYFTKNDDGWHRHWWGRVFLNPPSGNKHGRKTLRQWWNKLCVEYLTGRVETAVFCAFHMTLFNHPCRYVQPADNPFAIMRRKVQWVRPDGRRRTITTTTAFVLLAHDDEVRRRFILEFRDVAGVVGPLTS